MLAQQNQTITRVFLAPSWRWGTTVLLGSADRVGHRRVGAFEGVPARARVLVAVRARSLDAQPTPAVAVAAGEHGPGLGSGHAQCATPRTLWANRSTANDGHGTSYRRVEKLMIDASARENHRAAS